MSTTKVKATSGSPEVRHQLQKMVSGKLADRGISTKEIWSSKGKANVKLTKEEKERLERQRYNKREWARRDRARSKELLEKLRHENVTLEYRKQQLISDVDKFQQLNHQLREALTDHQCRLNVQKTFLNVPLADHCTDATASNDDFVEAKSYGGLKHSFLPTSPKQVGHAGRKRDTGKEASSVNFIPVTQSGFVVVDRLHSSQASAGSQHGQHSKMYRLLPIHHQIPLTAILGGSTGVHKLFLEPEIFSKVASVHGDAGGTTGVPEPQPPYTDAGGTSGQSLTSGGFTVSDNGKSFLQMLQEADDVEDDVEMKEDFRAPVDTRKTETGSGGQYIGDDEGSSVSGLPQTVTAMNSAETGGLKEALVMGPPSTSQGCMPLKLATESRLKSSDSAQDQVVLVTAGSSTNGTFDRQPDNAENDSKMTRSGGNDTRQTAENPSIPASPQKSHTAFSKPAKHRTRKGVLMERWFAQEHSRELKKKQKKKKQMRAVSLSSSKRIMINPWAVVSPSETKETSVPSHVVDSGGVVLGTMTTSVISDPNSKTSTRAISCSLADTQHAMAPEQSDAPFYVPVLQGPSTGSKAATSEVVTTATGNIGNATKSFLELLGIASDLCTQNADDDEEDDSSVLSLAEEGRGLTRRQSWPGEDADCGRSQELRPRSSSLPSSFSDVVFEVADSDAQGVFTSEQFLSFILNPEGADFEGARMVVVDSNPHTVASGGFSVTAPVADGTAMAAATSTQPIFLMDKMPSTPSTPSSPPTVCPFDTRAGASGSSSSGSGSSSSREAASSVQKAAVSGECSQQGQGRWERERTGARDNRVRVERVPDADINTWQAISLPPEHMDTFQWQTFTCL